MSPNRAGPFSGPFQKFRYLADPPCPLLRDRPAFKCRCAKDKETRRRGGRHAVTRLEARVYEIGGIMVDGSCARMSIYGTSRGFRRSKLRVVLWPALRDEARASVARVRSRPAVEIYLTGATETRASMARHGHL
jgi:hypothetical protein